MKKAYICSPYRADSEDILKRNIEYAKHLTKLALDDGYAPITPHLYLTQCLDDTIESERSIGLAAGVELLKTCDIIIVGVDYGITAGMRLELAAAYENGIHESYFSLEKEEDV